MTGVTDVIGRCGNRRCERLARNYHCAQQLDVDSGGYMCAAVD